MKMIKIYLIKKFTKTNKERFDEIIKLTEETNFDNLIHYFKGYSSRKKM